MARVLLTGSSGGVGRAARPVLEAAGWVVEPFDLTDGKDLCDEAAVLGAMTGCEAVVHAGAIAHDTAGTPADIVATNVLGTWHVLQAAQTHQVSRVVYFSSCQVFGFAEGEGTPAYLPVDDAHPLRAARPYGMSKRLAEEMCAAWTSRTGIPTIVLRPVMILSDAALRQVSETEAELGAFVHVDDVAAAIIRALSLQPDGHVRLTLCGPGPFDTSAARQILGWTPTRTWPSRAPSGS
ncbi:MAG TPA: NAD(P)-dependent oxidoreductase [Streptosporangiaceae bacterium]|nr:NAD(P)-dependent oxidoreductase [Streptosporangiaceae bacterium]